MTERSGEWSRRRNDTNDARREMTERSGEWSRRRNDTNDARIIT